MNPATNKTTMATESPAATKTTMTTETTKTTKTVKTMTTEEIDEEGRQMALLDELCAIFTDMDHDDIIHHSTEYYREIIAHQPVSYTDCLKWAVRRAMHKAGLLSKVDDCDDFLAVADTILSQRVSELVYPKYYTIEDPITGDLVHVDGDNDTRNDDVIYARGLFAKCTDYTPKKLSASVGDATPPPEPFRLDALFSPGAPRKRKRLPTFVCSVCKHPDEGFGNNPWPLEVKGVCCDFCHITRVMPARLSDSK